MICVCVWVSVYAQITNFMSDPGPGVGTLTRGSDSSIGGRVMPSANGVVVVPFLVQVVSPDTLADWCGGRGLTPLCAGAVQRFECGQCLDGSPVRPWLVWLAGGDRGKQLCAQ